MIEKEAPEATGIENQNLFFLEVAAEKLGDVKAQLILGKHYLAIEPDEEKALKYLEMAHNLGHAESTFLLGILYQSESEKIRNMNKSIELIQEAAVMGWPMAMAIIGDAYCRGKNGVERNIQTGLGWLKKSVGLDCPEGMYYLGIYYWLHNKQNEARQLWKRAGRYEKHIESIKILAASYRDSAKRNPNAKEAAEENMHSKYWYSQAVDLGDVESLSKLGWIYELVYDDREEASKYFNLAAAKGEPEGVFGLAIHYYLGVGTEDVNPLKSFALCNMAVDSGHEPAKSLLGMLYYSGEGGELNQEKGLSLLTERLVAGDNLARTFLIEIAEKSRDSRAKEVLASIA